MNCMLNGKEVFNLDETQVKLLNHLTADDELEETVKGLIHYIVGQKLRECAQKLFEEWKPLLLKEGVKQIPLMDIELAQQIFDRPDYVKRNKPIA